MPERENDLQSDPRSPPTVVLHRAPWVLSGDAEALPDGAVAMDSEGEVRAVGAFTEVRAAFSRATVREHRAVLTPGLVNAHVELDHAALRGKVPGGAGLARWRDALREAARGLDPDETEAALSRAVDELATAGTAAFASPLVGPSGTLADVCAARGLTAIELHAPSREAGAPASHPRLFSDPAERARPHSEGAEGLDLDALAARPGPRRVFVSLADARRDELDRLARARAFIVLLPRETLHIRTALPPLLEALAAGLAPALGTGSPAAAPSLDVLAEAAALRARFPTVPARALFAMCTAWSADALGLPLHGRLTPGARPGLLAFALPALTSPSSSGAPRDPFALVLASALSTRSWAHPPTASR